MATEDRHDTTAPLWREYQQLIESRVESCVDYLGRITRSIAGARSRHYVADKAQELRGAAHRLIHACHEAERWLASCEAEVCSEREAELYRQECTLPAGHLGLHEARRTDPPLVRFLQIAEELADASLTLSDTLGWMIRDPARTAEGADLADLDLALTRISHRLADVRRAFDALAQQATVRGAR